MMHSISGLIEGAASDGVSAQYEHIGVPSER